MSYILDALKKSEQDRGNGSIPNIQTIHSSALNYHQQKQPLWPWVLIAVLVTNVFILIYFLKPVTNTEIVTADHNAKTNSNEDYQSSRTTENHPVPAPAVIAAPVVTEPSLEPAISTLHDSAVATEVAVTTTPLKPVVDIDELPANIRQHVPDMVFSAHVYSSDAVQRSLVINGRFMEEGDAVSYDLILAEITRHGAIFNFRDYRFSISVLSGWSTQ
jgi:general secretion pathway protein B